MKNKAFSKNNLVNMGSPFGGKNSILATAKKYTESRQNGVFDIFGSIRKNFLLN